MEKVMVLGTGPAGLTAAIYLARAGLSPLVIEGMQPGGQLTTTSEIENFPGFPEGITGPELMDNMHKQAERFGARFEMNMVEKADFSEKPYKITLMGGDVHEAETVIISTGATAKYLKDDSVQALRGRGVSACATCDGAFYRDVPIAVVGGGDTACEEAMFLTRFASKVYLIHRRDQLRASPIMAERTKEHPKVEIVWDSVIDEVLDVEKGVVNGLKLRNVKTDAISELAIEGLFMGIGHQPNTEAFGDQLDSDEMGYLVTDNTKTNIEGVYACGDVQDSAYRQAVTAAGTGCMAALEAERYLEALGQ